MLIRCAFVLVLAGIAAAESSDPAVRAPQNSSSSVTLPAPKEATPATSDSAEKASAPPPAPSQAQTQASPAPAAGETKPAEATPKEQNKATPSKPVAAFWFINLKK